MDSATLDLLTEDIVNSSVFNGIVNISELSYFTKTRIVQYPSCYLIKVDTNVYFGVIFMDPLNVILFNPAHHKVAIPHDVRHMFNVVLHRKVVIISAAFVRDIQFMWHACVYYIEMSTYKNFVVDYSNCNIECAAIQRHVNNVTRLLFPPYRSFESYFLCICDFLKTKCPKYFNNLKYG